MFLKKKVDSWVKKKIITKAQADKIWALERSGNNLFFWHTAFIISGLLIGLGICLVVASNWNIIPPLAKLIGNYVLFGISVYLTRYFILTQRPFLKELFLIVCFFMVGASIGLNGQIFNLDGGWSQFSIAWAGLSLPFVLLSRSVVFNVVWICIFFGALPEDWIWLLERYIRDHFEGLIYATLIFALLSYAGRSLDKLTNKYTILPVGFSKLAALLMHLTVVLCGIRWGLFGSFSHNGAIPFFANAFVFVFLGCRIALAIMSQNVLSFKNNAFLAEIYIFALFCSRFGNLLTSGLGFIIGGIMVLLFLYALKLTSNHIKKMEIFK